MTRAYVGLLPEGSKGFDCNTNVSSQAARAFWDDGYRFVVRYVRRSTKHSYDITTSEITNLLGAGLGLMIVQHVAAEGWVPNKELGFRYGLTAGMESKSVGIPQGVAVWCDLEGVRPGVPHQDVIDYCNAWFDQVRAQGFDPGLYVGYGCGLTSGELYYKLKFRRYWAAYNLNRDQYPAVRNVCMQQGPYPKASQRTNVPFEYDTDVIQRDNFNNLPKLLLPEAAG